MELSDVGFALLVLAGIFMVGLGEAGNGQAEETLYNGLRPPSPWPPRGDSLSLAPVTPPYLTSPPGVIPIDVGRQLFVDDFLIEETTLQRTFHIASFYRDNPVLKPDKAWEMEGKGAMAMPFSSGVWWDPQDRLLKMWYMGGYNRYLCFAASTDGLHWDKPELDVRPGTNILREWTGANVVWLDLEERDASRRYKLISTNDGADLIGPDQEWYGSKCFMSVHFSPDGIHWGDAVVRTGATGDRNSGFWNAFRKRWVYSIRACLPFGGLKHSMRCRRYWETSDLTTPASWKPDEPPLWVGADNLDLRRLDHNNAQPEIYTLDAVAYESVLLGLFTIWRGDGNTPPGRPKPNELCIAFSRDGFHWHRPSHEAFIPISERKGDWNWGNVQSTGGCCLVMGDQLHFYVSGRAGGEPGGFCDANGNTGLAILRRDGFVSLDAGENEGSLSTRPVQFSGKYLFVNAEVGQGELRVEVLDKDGKVIAPFNRANCSKLHADKTLQPVKWKGARDLSRLAGIPVRFRFHLKNGKLFAFWVTPDKSGVSHGYVAAGGPGFTGSLDVEGQAAYYMARNQASAESARK